MKRIIAAITLLVFPYIVLGQGLTTCPGITVLKDEMNQSVNYASKTNYNGIWVMKIIQPGLNFTTLVLNILVPEMDLDSEGLMIKFEDGVILRNLKSKNKCTYFRDGMYQLIGTYELTNIDSEQFKTKKIVKIQLGSATFAIPDKYASALLEDIKCIETLN